MNKKLRSTVAALAAVGLIGAMSASAFAAAAGSKTLMNPSLADVSQTGANAIAPAMAAPTSIDLAPAHVMVKSKDDYGKIMLADAIGGGGFKGGTTFVGPSILAEGAGGGGACTPLAAALT